MLVFDFFGEGFYVFLFSSSVVELVLDSSVSGLNFACNVPF